MGLGDGANTYYENVDAAWIDATTGDLYLATNGDFTTGAGFGGDQDDIVYCAAAVLGETTSRTWHFHWNGAEHGFGGENIDGLAFSGAIALPPPLPTPAVLTVTGIYLNALGGTGTGLAFNTNDILHYDVATGLWSMVFDGSDVGVVGGVDGFLLDSDGSLLLSLAVAATLPGAGAVEPADIVRFTPAQLGPATTGTFAMLLDGSDVGLDTSGENIDAWGVRLTAACSSALQARSAPAASAAATRTSICSPRPRWARRRRALGRATSTVRTSRSTRRRARTSTVSGSIRPPVHST